MKYLGVDYGTKKIGIAISDEDGEFAFPKKIIENKNNLKEIIEIAKEEKIVAVVVGGSFATNESKNEIFDDIERFTEKISKDLGVPVHIEREDFSSVEAHRYQTKRGDRDDSAAAIILQRFLDKIKKQ